MHIKNPVNYCIRVGETLMHCGQPAHPQSVISGEEIDPRVTVIQFAFPLSGDAKYLLIMIEIILSLV